MQDYTAEEMEFKNLNEEVRSEAGRVKAAFGVKKWKRIDPRINGEKMEGFDADNNRIEFYYLEGSDKPRLISVGKDQDTNSTWDEEDGQVRTHFHESDAVLARGLYRLGLDEDVLSQLPPLSADERAELRHSMPREFWPQKWLDEE